jgi:hypothetical protein
MKENIFIKEFDRLNQAQKAACASFWDCLPDAHDILGVLKSDFVAKLDKLGKLETRIFFHILSSEENLSENRLKSLTGFEDNELSFAVNSLNEKMFVYLRKSIAKLSSGNDKIITFEIIKDLLSGFKIVDNFEDLEEIFSLGRLYLSFPDEELFSLFFKNNGYIKQGSKLLKNINVDKAVKNKLLELKIVFKNEKIFPAYIINKSFIKPFEPKSSNYISKGLNILNVLGSMYYLLSTKNVLLNKSGELCKYDFDLLTEIFKENDIMDFFLELLYRNGCIFDDNKKMVASAEFKDLMQKDYITFYKNYILSNSKTNRFCELFLSDTKDYSDIDIIRIAEKENINSDELLFINRLLVYTGLSDISTEKGRYIPSKLYYSIKNNSQFAHSQEASLIVNTNFTVVADSAKLSLYDEYILKTFFNLENTGNVKIFKIDKKSFYKGIFLGFKPELVINILKKKSSKPVPEMIYVIMNDWNNSYKEVKIEKAVIIKGPKETLDLIFYNKDLEKYIIQRHGDNLIEVLEEAASVKMLEEENIFIINN